MTPAEFQARLDVSRETLEKFQAYGALLTKWNRAINLVSPRSLEDLWRRHFLDSAQLRRHLPALPGDAGRVILDVGAGAGFPGLVLPVLGCGLVHLVGLGRASCRERGGPYVYTCVGAGSLKHKHKHDQY